MFDLLMSLGAEPSLDIENKRELTPLTLAATLARSEVSCENRRVVKLPVIYVGGKLSVTYR